MCSAPLPSRFECAQRVLGSGRQSRLHPCDFLLHHFSRQSFCCHLRLLITAAGKWQPDLEPFHFMHSHEQLPDVRRRNLATVMCCLCKCFFVFHQLTLGLVDMCNDAFGNLAKDVVCSMIGWHVDSPSKSEGSRKALNAGLDLHGRIRLYTLCQSNRICRVQIYIGRTGGGGGRCAAAFPNNPTTQQPQPSTIPTVPTAPTIPINCPTAPTIPTWAQQKPQPQSGANCLNFCTQRKTSRTWFFFPLLNKGLQSPESTQQRLHPGINSPRPPNLLHPTSQVAQYRPNKGQGCHPGINANSPRLSEPSEQAPRWRCLFDHRYQSLEAASTLPQILQERHYVPKLAASYLPCKLPNGSQTGTSPWHHHAPHSNENLQSNRQKMSIKVWICSAAPYLASLSTVGLASLASRWNQKSFMPKMVRTNTEIKHCHATWQAHE